MCVWGKCFNSLCLLCQIPGLVNVDFADVRAIMANAGSSLMGIGTATGKALVCIVLSYNHYIVLCASVNW